MAVIIEDYFPTLLDIAGVQSHDFRQEVDGQSFLPLLKGKELNNQNRILTWHFPYKWKKEDLPQIDYMSAIRQRDWKLVYDMKTCKLELYNLKMDIGELNDVSSVYPEKVKQLEKKLGERFRAWEVFMPRYKSNGNDVSWPDELTVLQK